MDPFEEDPNARIEVRRVGNLIVIKHTASGNHIELTRRQAAAVMTLVELVRAEITEEDG
jgi:hypothetical protein